MITTVNDGWELYLYMNGVLIYKRWLKRGTDMLMHDNEGLTQFCHIPFRCPGYCGYSITNCHCK